MEKEIKEEAMSTTENKTRAKKSTPKKEPLSSKVKLQKLKDLEGEFLLVKVGTADRPASDSEIKDIQEKLLALFEENDINCVTFVTHHAVTMEIIGR